MGNGDQKWPRISGEEVAYQKIYDPQRKESCKKSVRFVQRLIVIVLVMVEEVPLPSLARMRAVHLTRSLHHGKRVVVKNGEFKEQRGMLVSLLHVSAAIIDAQGRTPHAMKVAKAAPNRIHLHLRRRTARVGFLLLFRIESILRRVVRLASPHSIAPLFPRPVHSLLLPSPLVRRRKECGMTGEMSRPLFLLAARRVFLRTFLWCRSPTLHRFPTHHQSMPPLKEGRQCFLTGAAVGEAQERRMVSIPGMRTS